MAGIKGTNTKPERELRLALHGLGFRYRLHVKDLIGRPDLVFPRYHAVVFVHGCLWHRHEGCRYATTPTTRPEFWQTKFTANVARDKLVTAELLRAGWRVATVWECALRGRGQVDRTAEQLSRWLVSGNSVFEVPSAVSSRV